MPMGKGTYGSQKGRPKKDKREQMYVGSMPGKRKKMMGGSMMHSDKRMMKGTGGRIQYMDGGPVTDNTPMATPN